jgi:RsiW-degrading membrane proteinase PrsW (M82 family)
VEVRVLLARRWSWVLVLVVGVVLYESVRQAVADTGNPNLLPALLLLGAAVVPVAFVTFVAGRRLVFDIGGGLVFGTALVGGVVGVVTAGVLEYGTLQRLGVIPLVAVGLIEEAAKLIVPVLLVLVLRRHRHPADGLLLGVACGVGFAVLETMGYGFVVLVRSGGDLGVVEQVLFARGVLSPAAHMAWTGLTAAALWTAAAAGWSARALARFVVVYVVVVALHTAWDTLASTAADIALAAVSLGLLAWTTHQLAAPHRRTPGGHDRVPAGSLGAG